MKFRIAAIIVFGVGVGVGVAGHAEPAPVAAPAATPVAKARTSSADAHHRRAPPFRSFVDMPTFMDHVLTPAATIIWRTNGFINDAGGEHDLSPKTEADWELVVSGAATLAEATNALRIPQRAVDGDWNAYVDRLADAAARAYEAAEKHDLKTVADVSDHLDEVCSSCHRHYHYE